MNAKDFKITAGTPVWSPDHHRIGIVEVYDPEFCTLNLGNGEYDAAATSDLRPVNNGK